MAEPRAPFHAGTAAGDGPLSFRAYVMVRKYDFGRGSSAAWRFIAFARGAADFPDAASWRELEAYLERAGRTGEYIGPARTVWNSFTAFRSRTNRSPEPARRARSS